MTSRTIRRALLPAAVLAALSCSKTQDTSPERRIFGDPPTIQSVDPEYFTAQSAISCDFTEIVSRQLCRQINDVGGNIQASDIQAQPGCGWFGINEDGTPKMNTVCEDRAGVFVEGSYGEARFVASVKDPNSTTEQSNILFVSSSFVQPPPSTTEISLVMFDDGKATKFPNAQKVSTIGEDCSEECVCINKTFGVSSGDDTAKDGVYTRKLAFVRTNSNEFLLDCIMRDREETLTFMDPGSALSFKIEAVDRQGNLATWPQKLNLTTGEDNFNCNGDSCGCCFMQGKGGLPAECKDLPGLIIPGFAPNGLCVDAL